jgi:hypothetical protein
MPYKDPEVQKAYDKQKYLKNRERILERQRRWHWANREEANAKSSAYQKEHREQCTARQLAWKRDNQSEERRAKQRQRVNLWRKKNPEKMRERLRRAYKKDRRKFIAKNFIHVALKWGVLVRPSKCQKCEMDCRPQAHHLSYDPPLRMEWLCHKCHVRAHHPHSKV